VALALYGYCLFVDLRRIFDLGRRVLSALDLGAAMEALLLRAVGKYSPKPE